jgi:sulfide dehydrogenase cytochrome subunit
MGKVFMVAAASWVFWALPGLVHAQAQPNGRNLAASCAICHGSEGRAVTPSVTSLAGMPRDQISLQLREFRDGKRPATVMDQIAKGYTDEQIDAIALWYSAQKR